MRIRLLARLDRAIASLRQNLRGVALTLELPALWRWWMAELAPLVPATPRAAVQRRRLRPVLAFSDDSVVVWDPRVKDAALAFVEVARIPLTGDAAAVAQAGRAAIEALPARAGESSANVIITLPRSHVLRKQIVLPAAVEDNLVQTLTYDLDRHTPFRPEQVYFDATVVARDPVKREIRVDWAAALKTLVDQARVKAESWGAKVVGVAPETLSPMSAAMANPAAWSRLNLLPHGDRIDSSSWRRWQFWIPLSLLLIAGIVAVSLPLWQKREYAVELGQVTEDTRRQAAAADTLRQQLDAATGDYNFALGKKYAFPSTMQLLEDVTKLLPDDTWLTQLEIKTLTKNKETHREMLLRGESGNAGRLISALEESKLFEQAAPRSPTTKIQPGPGEVFDLGTQVVPSPAPQLVALANINTARSSATESSQESPAGAAKTPAAGAKGGAPDASRPPAADMAKAATSQRPLPHVVQPTTTDAEDDEIMGRDSAAMPSNPVSSMPPRPARSGPSLPAPGPLPPPARTSRPPPLSTLPAPPGMTGATPDAATPPAAAASRPAVQPNGGRKP